MEMRRMKNQICELCLRTGVKTTKHHLYPKMVVTRHSLREQMRKDGRSREEISMICTPCHRQIHRIFKEKELAFELNSIEKIASHPEVKKFVKWIKKQPPETLFSCRK